MNKQTPVTPIHGFVSLQCGALRHHACDYGSCPCTCHPAVAQSEPFVADAFAASCTEADGLDCGVAAEVHRCVDSWEVVDGNAQAAPPLLPSGDSTNS